MERLNYYDNAKFYLILSVILGHLLENNGLYGRISIGLFDTIFLYAMPSFVFISGIFSPPHQDKDKKDRIVRFLISIWGLFEPLLICSLILAIPTILTYGFSLDLLRPGYTLWYLLALIWWRLIVYFLPSCITKFRSQVFLLTMIISLLSGFISWGNSIAFPRMLYFLPYFWLGYSFSSKKEEIILFVKKIPKGISIIIMVSFLIMNAVLYYNQANYSAGNVPYARWNMSLAQSLIWWSIFSVMRIVASICVLSLIPRSKTWFSTFGLNSFIIYVYHAMLLTLIMIINQSFDLHKTIYLTIIEFLIVTPTLLAITKLKFAKIAIAPITYFLRKKYSKTSL